MKNFFLKIVTVLFFGINSVLIAQGMPQPGPPGGGTGGVGPGGKPKNPIDMYEYILVIAAVLLVIYFYKRSKKLKLS